MEEKISITNLKILHPNPCDYKETPKGIAGFIGVDSVMNEGVTDIFEIIKPRINEFESHFKMIADNKKLGVKGIYKKLDAKGNKIQVKLSSRKDLYLCEGYHRVFALLLLGETFLLKEYIEVKNLSPKEESIVYNN